MILLSVLFTVALLLLIVSSQVLCNIFTCGVVVLAMFFVCLILLTYSIFFSPLIMALIILYCIIKQLDNDKMIK